MTTLTLVPLNNTYVNPEEIAAIGPDFLNSSRTIITLRGNQIEVVINWSVEEVIDRLKNHFAPTTPEESAVLDATNILKYAAKSFPDNCDPIRLAAGIEDVAQMLEKSKDWQKSN